MKKPVKLALIFISFLVIAGIFLYQILPQWFPVVSITFPKTTTPSANQELAITYPVAAWSWQTPLSYSEQEVHFLAKQLVDAHVSTVYLDISPAIDLKEAKDGPGLVAFNQQLKTYVKAMSAQNIAVHSLTGDKNWSDPSYRYLTLLTLEYVKEYNASATDNEKLTGIHFDIEPYSQEHFNDDQKLVLIEYLAMAQQIRLQLEKDYPDAKSRLELGFDIPYWFDGQNNNIPKVEWNGKIAYPFDHLADELDTYGNGYVAIMAYRNYADGGDGTINLVKREFEYTENSSVRIIVGQELNPEDPPKVSFAGKKKQELLVELDKINTAYKDRHNYHGFAMHEVKSLLPYYESKK